MEDVQRAADEAGGLFPTVAMRKRQSGYIVCVSVRAIPVAVQLNQQIQPGLGSSELVKHGRAWHNRSTISDFNIMLHDFLLGFIKIHILYHAAHEPVYGSALMEELRRHGYEISPGTLYPILHNLLEQGYLERQSRVVGGKVRKYYAITSRGRSALDEARPKLRELVDEVLHGAGPTNLPEPLDNDRETDEG